jgi:hypothetical protein
VQVIGNIYNTTTGLITQQAFASPNNLQAGWGFWAWTVDPALLNGRGDGVNVTITIASLTPGSAMAPLLGPVVLVADPPAYHQPATQVPQGPALYIGLPTILGFVLLMAVGTYIWNRKSRRIGLGNIMSRSRHGYAVGMSRSQRVRLGGGRKDRLKEQGIHLMEREVPHQYRDAPEPTPRGPDSTGWLQEVPGRKGPRGADLRVDVSHSGVPRRDSDALGSLAGTPTEERSMDFGRRPPAGNNAFRAELERQDMDRQRGGF